MIHIYCGDGKGKTTASVGLAVRMAGHGKRVLFMQFLKGSYTGELEILSGTGNIKLMRCDRDYGFSFSMSDKDREEISVNHNESLSYALSRMTDYYMIVLDEIFPALSLGLADEEAVKKLVGKYSGELVLTGRNPDPWFIERADYVSEIKKVKHPYDRGITAREGVEF